MEHILFKSPCLDLWITEELKHKVSINNARLIDHFSSAVVHQSGTHSINPSASRSSLTLQGTCQQKKSSTFLIVIFFNISQSHVSLSFVCFLIGLDLLFLTAERLRSEAGGRKRVRETQRSPLSGAFSRGSEERSDLEPVRRPAELFLRTPPRAKDLLLKSQLSFLWNVSAVNSVNSGSDVVSFWLGSKPESSIRCHGNTASIKELMQNEVFKLDIMATCCPKPSFTATLIQ